MFGGRVKSAQHLKYGRTARAAASGARAKNALSRVKSVAPATAPPKRKGVKESTALGAAVDDSGQSDLFSSSSTLQTSRLINSFVYVLLFRSRESIAVPRQKTRKVAELSLLGHGSDGNRRAALQPHRQQATQRILWKRNVASRSL